MSIRTDSHDRLQALHEAGAPAREPVGWHYLQTLAARTAAHAGTTQALLEHKLQQALDAFEARWHTGPAPQAPAPTRPSPLARLLQEMGQNLAAVSTGPATAASSQPLPAPGLRPENPRMRQFRRQLRKISVQKQVRQAIAQAPQNAGPINSHMLVLRALGLMRDISPDYLDRFMIHLDTLLCLEDAEKNRLAPIKKSAPASKSRR